MREDYVLVTDAAAELQMSRAGVWKAIQRGRLHAEWFGPLRVIRRDELERFKALPRRRGRPPKPKV
jgi:hypothetical protein